MITDKVRSRGGVRCRAHPPPGSRLPSRYIWTGGRCAARPIPLSPVPDDEPDLDWFNRPRNPSDPDPDPDGFDQSPTWKPEEIQLDDGRILVLEYT